MPTGLSMMMSEGTNCFRALVGKRTQLESKVRDWLSNRHSSTINQTQSWRGTRPSGEVGCRIGYLLVVGISSMSASLIRGRGATRCRIGYGARVGYTRKRNYGACSFLALGVVGSCLEDWEAGECRCCYRHHISCNRFFGLSFRRALDQNLVDFACHHFLVRTTRMGCHLTDI